MKKKKIKECKTCRYYTYDFCRRFPPQVYFDSHSAYMKEKEVKEKYPKVEEYGWCGEYKRL